MLNAKRYKMLDFVELNALVNWSVQYLSDSAIKFNGKYPLMRIGDFLARNKATVTIQDGKKYKRVTIRVRNGGVVLRDEVMGEDIGTKKQFLVSEGQFILSKIDARNGAMGIIPADLNGAVVTQDFLPYDIDTTLVNPQYFVLVCTTKQFVAFCQSCSSGTTNRQRVDETQFLNIKVPIPSLEEQNELVEEYNKHVLLANHLTEKAKVLEDDIQEFIISKLGVKLPKSITRKFNSCNLISFVNYKDVDRWDVWSKEHYISTLINKSIYPIVNLGACDFINRGWKKDTENFRYIEMGDVDPMFGIVNDTTLSTNNAPSRATQRINTGDLIIGTTRPYLKRFAIVSAEHNQCICSSAFQVIKPNARYNIEYIYYFLQTQLAITQFEAYMTGGLYPAINTSDLRQIKMPLPPVSVQDSIVRYANKKRMAARRYMSEGKKTYSEVLKNFEVQIFE